MKIGIIGLGLIGGSIFRALNREKYEVVGVSSSVNAENVSKDYSVLSDCDVVFVCTPMAVIIDILDKLESVVRPSTIVTDVCSVKEFVSKKKYSYKFIPSHPMAGTENSGWESSFAELFNGAKWIITPIEEYADESQDILEQVIEDLGAKVVITTPQEHDEAVALISHVPMIVAQALCENIKDNKLAQVLASSGFRDTTRLALSNVQMASDMVTLNRNNIEESLKLLQDSIDMILNEDYESVAQRIKEFRKNLY